jgi:hypothetical protein
LPHNIRHLLHLADRCRVAEVQARTLRGVLTGWVGRRPVPEVERAVSLVSCREWLGAEAVPRICWECRLVLEQSGKGRMSFGHAVCNRLCRKIDT